MLIHQLAVVFSGPMPRVLLCWWKFLLFPLPFFPLFPLLLHRVPEPASEGRKSRDVLEEDTLVRPKTVLLWTPWWGNQEKRQGKDWHLGENPFANCPVSRCTITVDREEQPVHMHDAILFHSWDLFQFDMRLPEKRSDFQRYILFSIEPVQNCGGLTDWEYGALDDFFNATASFRNDADVVVPYGRLERREGREENSGSGWGGDLLLEKSRSVLFVTSHCVTDSDREGVAMRLNKTIEIDFRGGCASEWDTRVRGPHRDRHRHGTHMNVELYYFYLAFENSICQDYVTEKFFDAMAANVVPVVYGGANYSQLAPPHSFIDIQDFPNEEAAGLYLQHLIDNPKEYQEYFWWKPYYKVAGIGDSSLTMDRIPPSFPCSLCAELHSKSQTKQYR